MSLSSEVRDQRLDQLIRPIVWALGVAIFSTLMLYTLWTDPNVTTITTEMIAYAALSSLVAVAVLLFWGIRRIMNAARGRHEQL